MSKSIKPNFIPFLTNRHCRQPCWILIEDMGYARRVFNSYSGFHWLCGIPQLRTQIRFRHKHVTGEDVYYKEYSFKSYFIFYIATIAVFVLNCYADKEPLESKYPQSEVTDNSDKLSLIIIICISIDVVINLMTHPYDWIYRNHIQSTALAFCLVCSLCGWVHWFGKAIDNHSSEKTCGISSQKILPKKLCQFSSSIGIILLLRLVDKKCKFDERK